MQTYFILWYDKHMVCLLWQRLAELPRSMSLGTTGCQSSLAGWGRTKMRGDIWMSKADKMNCPQRTACFAKGKHWYTFFTLNSTGLVTFSGTVWCHNLAANCRFCLYMDWRMNERTNGRTDGRTEIWQFLLFPGSKRALYLGLVSLVRSTRSDYHFAC